MNQTTPLTGKLSISRPCGANTTEHPVITIEVEDAGSGVRFVEVEIPAEAFALALTGMGAVTCKFTVGGLHLIGTRREVKTELVAFDKYETGAAARIDACLEEFHRDGWRGSASDMMNSHRTVAQKGFPTYQRVHFTRFLDADGKPVLDPRT